MCIDLYVLIDCLVYSLHYVFITALFHAWFQILEVMITELLPVEIQQDG